MGDYDTRAPRVTLTNMVTADSLEVQFNPREIEETFGATYAKLTVPGLSHQRKHFVNTNDVVYSFELFNHCKQSGNNGLTAMQAIRRDKRWLMSLVFPWRSSGIKRGGAPRVLLTWPQMIAMQCVVTGMKFKSDLFNKNNAPIGWTCSITMEWQLDAFLSMEEVLISGAGNEVD